MKEQTMAVQRMQDYIEAHLSEKITLGDLAEVSLYSPWHSYRIFQDYLGMTPTEYIRRFRLSTLSIGMLVFSGTTLPIRCCRSSLCLESL